MEYNLLSVNFSFPAKDAEGMSGEDFFGAPFKLGAQMAGQQAQEGLGSFLPFVAILSINLGVLNLLPIPILDGGHLLFFLVEMVIGRPVALRHREMAQQVGLFLLMLLMIYAFYNDIARIFEKQAGG